MSEVVAPDRSRLLRSKRAESSGIVLSRKRKLREIYAVCDHEGPLPTINLSNPDAPPTNDAEKHFLDACDLSQNRLFDEATLPARRQLRSDTSKQQSPTRLVSPGPGIADALCKVTKPERNDEARRSRATTPVAKVDERPHGDLPNGKDEEDGSVTDGISMQRSSSKGSQTDLPPDSAAVLNEIVEETFESATQAQAQPSLPDASIPPDALESEKIAKEVESRPGSPGVDPRQAVPVSAEEAAILPEPLIDGQASHDPNHKAATVHLPPKEVQEQRLREVKAEKVTREQQKEEAGRLSINLPSRDGGRSADALSSPGSTSHSATTPALHDASTDTSPDNGSRYEAERLDKDEVPETPPELRPTPEEVAEKEEHDSIHKAQLEISRAEALRSSPADVDAQIRSEEQAAVNYSESTEDVQMEDAGPGEADKSDGLTKEAEEVVQDTVEDEEEVATIPTPAEKPPAPSPQVQDKQPEVADSEDDQTPVDTMDVDATTVKDSFETNPSSDNVPGSSPAAQPVVEPPEKSAKCSKEPTPAPPAVPTPQQTPSASAVPPPTLERMTTRVASGAMRHKSVSEILGEIPRPNTSSGSERSVVGKGATDSDSAAGSNTPSRSATPQSPGTRARSLIDRAKEKERSKLSTVVFAKQPSKRKSDEVALRANGKKEPQPEPEDYFLPMWRARPDARFIQPIDSLLGTAHKTITTSNMFLPHLENQTFRVLKRIKDLQEFNKWSLRQYKRSQEPNRPTTHWDVVIQEAKWMRTDFREERKWKMAVARNLASACAEWHEASAEDKKLLQVKATPPPMPTTEPSKETEMTDVASNQAHPTPDLVASSGDVDSPIDEFDEEPRLNLLETVAPTAIFGLQDDDVVFGLRRSPNTDKLLDELPMYSSPLSVPQSSLPTSDFDPDAAWRRPLLPLSKYVEGRMELKNDGPPRTRSRFDYEDEDEDEDSVIFGEPPAKRPKLAPEMTHVALFNPENKHIRDRIHAGHQFRPPSEFPMPSQSFFECRTASQWTWAEDDELKSLVREYSYNWSLISSMLTSKSIFSSGAERRTPWECFERWIHLEGLPADMQKTHYFKAYNNRIEMAQRTVLEQAAMAAPSQTNAAGQLITPARRRFTTSVRVERRRNQKHLTLVDAMRKLAKKRETSLQKQQHAASVSAARPKPQESTQPRAPAHTPQDFSRLKHERDLAFQERMVRFQQQAEQQRRANMAARNPQMPQSGGPPQQVNRGLAPPNGPNGQPIQNPNQLAVPGQNRPRTAMAPNPMAQVPMQNGLQVPQMPMNGVPQAQMQGMPGRLPVPNPALDINLVTQARRISEQQRQAVQMQQQGQQHPGQPSQIHSSPPNMRNGNPMNGMGPPFIPNPNMMPPFNPNPHGVSTPPANGQGMPTPGSAGSPRMGQAGPQMLSNGTIPQVSAMEASLRQKYPNASPDHIRHMISESMAKQVHQRQLSQSAMNAAAGGNVNSNGNGGQPRVPNGVENSPQLYAQMLRAQQQQQQQQQNSVQPNHTPMQQQPQPQQIPRTGSAGSNGGNGGNTGNNGNGGGNGGNAGK